MINAIYTNEQYLNDINSMVVFDFKIDPLFILAILKWLFSFCMLAGRLELFAVFLLFLPGTYKK